MRPLRPSSAGRGAARSRWRLRSVALTFVAVTLSAALVGAAAAGGRPLDAFPGAEGFGREAQGGRGGRIVAVTNLADAGPGSLRACILQTGPRTCIFRIAGLIVLERSLLVDGETAAFLSILGQTAPGDGITITVAEGSTDFMRTPLIVRNTHDVVLRHVRLRSQAAEDVPNVDALTIEDSWRVYVDHVSGSWASDENVNIQGGSTEITIARSIFGEGLRRHSKCALFGSQATGAQNISFWRNLCLSNNDRNPDDNHFARSCVEIVDNLFYNARSEWAEIFSQHAGGTPISFVGNFFKAGPSTLDHTDAINWNGTDRVADPRIFAKDNAVWAPPAKDLTLVAEDTLRFLVDTPPCPLGVTALGPAARSYEAVRGQAGAFPRDAVDRRFVEEVGDIGVEGRGSLKRRPGVIPAIPPAIPYVDGDGDGMADGEEGLFEARPGVGDAWSLSGDGRWPSFDRFMEWLSDERLAGRYPR